MAEINFYQEICLNGHLINKKSQKTVDPKAFCEKCGDKVIVSCQECGKLIRGTSQIFDINDGYPEKIFTKPNYCRFCGEPYPWTKMILENAFDLISQDDNLSKNDKDLIKSYLPDLLKDTSKAPIVATKFKNLMTSATSVVKDMMYDIMIDVLSEPIKRTIYPS